MADDADRSPNAHDSAGDSMPTADSNGSNDSGGEHASSDDVEAAAAADDSIDGSDPSADGAAEATSRSEVVVPMALYKVVTVFSTLFAIALVVGGMITLDLATGRATLDADEIRLPIAFLGVASIVLGAAIYAFAARFRAEGMGNPKDGDDQP